MQFNNPSIIVSKTDSAGMNIAEHLMKNFNFNKTEKTFDSNPVYSNGSLKLVFIEKRQVFADYVNELDSDLFIFASKHRSESGKPCFTIHPIGNFGKAELGGKDNSLVPTSAVFNKNLILALKEEAQKSDLGWSVLAEISHHGPSTEKPTSFIEIGSSEAEWKNKEAGRIIANAVMSGISSKKENYKIAIGAGGTHYCPEFTKILLRTDIALSHIISKYAVDSLNENTFKQMIEKTTEKVDFMLIDWKGLVAEQRQKIIILCEKEELEYKKTRDFL